MRKDYYRSNRMMKKAMAFIVTSAMLMGNFSGVMATTVSAKDGDSSVQTVDQILDITDESEASAVKAVAMTYDADDISSFKDRTREEVAARYSQARYSGATYANGDSASWYSTKPSTKSPYNAGVLTKDTHTAMTEMTNFYRWLIGVYELDGVSTSSSALQTGALIRNFDFNHAVSSSKKPSDMSDSMWNTGASASHNILAMGYTPQGAISGWLDEGYSKYTGTWDTLGHRTALLGSGVSKVNYGYSGSVAIGLVTSGGKGYKEAFSAYPAPGYMPNNFISPGYSAWSIWFNSSKIKASDASKVVVTIENLTTGKAYTRTSSSGTAQVSSYTINFVQPYEDNVSRYVDDYQVTITGLTDVATGYEAEVRYKVKFFDVNDYAPSYIKSVSADGNTYEVGPDAITNSTFMKYLAASLGTTATATLETGKKVEVPTTGNWKWDASKSVFYNSIDVSALPSGVTDKNGLCGRVEIPVAKADNSWSSLSVTTLTPENGASITFSAYRYWSGANTVKLVQLIKQSDGSYVINKVYDETSSQYTLDGNYHKFKLDNVSSVNSGVYLTMYRYDWDTEWHVSTTAKEIKVQAPEVLVESVSVSTGSKTFHIYDTSAATTMTLNATITPSDATRQNLTYTSSNTNVATVVADASGKSATVKAIAPGESTITVKSVNGKTATCKVTVIGQHEKAQLPAVIVAGDTRIVLEQQEGCEFSVDGITWQDSNVFENLEENKSYDIFARKKATAYYIAGPNSDIANVRTKSKEIAHDYQTSIIKARPNEDGYKRIICAGCADFTEEIYKAPTTMTLSATKYTYANKVYKPTVTITDADGNIIDPSEYTVTYSGNCINAGTYTVTADFDGSDRYDGTMSKTFTIAKANQTITASSYTKTYGSSAFSLGAKRTVGNGKVTYKSSSTSVATISSAGKVTIKGVGKTTITITAAATDNYNKATKTVTITVKPVKTSISKLTAGSKRFTVRWAKKSTQVTGYQIQYSTSSSFASGNKTSTVTSYKTTSRTIKSLKAKKKYYVRIRTYKTVGGVKYYSAWSAKKYVTTKK